MSCQATPRKLLDKFNFIVECERLASDAAFLTFTEPKASVDKVMYRPGGSRYEIKSPGLATFDDVTLTRGATKSNHELEAWFRQVLNAGATPNEAGRYRYFPLGVGAEEDYCCNVKVHSLGKDHRINKSWIFIRAWPSEFSPFDGMDSNASERMIESMTLTYDYFDRIDTELGRQINIGIYESRGGVSTEVSVSTGFGDLSTTFSR